MTPSQGVLPHYLITVLIWGSTWLAITYQLGTVPHAWSIAYRFLIAGGVMLAWLLWRGRALEFPWKAHGFFVLLACFQFGINFHLIYPAEELVPSGLIAVAFALMVVFNAALARLFLRIKLTSAMAIGGALSLLGVVLLFWPEIERFNFTDAGLLGLSLAVAGAFSASIGNVLQGTKSAKALPADAMVAWGMFYAGLLSALLASATAGPPVWDARWTYGAALLFLALLGSVVTFSLYMTIIRRAGVSKAAYVSVLTPIVALLWSTLLEGYQWSLLAALGAGLTLLGTLVAVRGKG
jgi:drug/metabolite transporter (DMT)-like permease